MKSFLDGAKGLAKNPLGIIALFISFIYLTAALVLGVSNGLEPAQKWPIVWFVVIFPLIILIVFVYLVVNHNTKLYGPSDYRDEGNFVRITTDLQGKKTIFEVNEVIESLDEQQIKSEQAEQPEKRKISDSTLENNSASLLQENIKYSYLVAEDLVVRQLEQELNISFERHMAYSRNNLMTAFDAIARINNQTFGLEVKYVRSERNIKNAVYSLIKKISSIEAEKLANFKLIIALVYDETSIRNNEEIESYFKNISFPVHIKQFDFKELKEKFGLF